MANTYTQLYIQCVFAVKFREAMLHPEWDHELRLYITTVLQNNGHKMLAINNMEDHMHFFVGLNPKHSISDMMKSAKADSSRWINQRGFLRRKFNWQDGFGAFSYSRSHIDNVVKYIINQQEHHKKISFLDEYRMMLKKFNIDFDERYIFKEPI